MSVTTFDVPTQWFCSIGVYGAVLSFLLYVIYENKVILHRSAPLPFLSCLAFSLALRICWMFPKAYDVDGELAVKLSSRFSTLIQFTAITLLVQGWYMSMQLSSSSLTQVPRVRAFFFTLNALFYIAVLGTTRESENNMTSVVGVDEAYRVNSALLVVAFVCVFLFILVYGRRLEKMVRATSLSPEAKQTALPKIIAISWSLLFCFSLRAAAFLHTPVTGRYTIGILWMDLSSYPWCFYHIPELVPAVIIGTTMLSDRHEKGLKVWIKKKCCGGGEEDKKSADNGIRINDRYEGGGEDEVRNVV